MDLAKIYGCYFCHTPFENNQLAESKPFAGGHVFNLGKDGRAVSANLTPDTETGPGKWTEDRFIAKFAEYKEYAANGPPKIPLALNTTMPWLELSQTPAEDLKTIFARLRAVPVIHNAVVLQPRRARRKGKETVDTPCLASTR